MDYTKLEKYLVKKERNDHFVGEQLVFMFENGYGASVVPWGYGSDEGLLELAVIKKHTNDDDWSINYGTSIADDVLGYLTEKEVLDLLERIKNLNSKTGKESLWAKMKITKQSLIGLIR